MKGSSYSGNTQKESWGSSFRNVGGCKTQISLKRLRTTILQKSAFQSYSQRKTSSNDFSINLQLTKQSHIGINWYVVTKSQIGWFYLLTNETSQIGPSHSRTSCNVMMKS